ncbi:MAG: hypothetical protein HON90_07535, partial [Halobacteriovoraceae bacterium]|nr:hypothetical protein [Halobacteriovoraceae bacterium]
VDAKNAHCENVLETNYLGGDFTRGKLLASKEREFSRPDGSTVKISCTMCHGENGLMPEQSRAGTLHPDLAALGEAYVFSTLASFRIGSRVGGPMGIITAQLSDDDLADLAAYYSQLNRCSSF